MSLIDIFFGFEGRINRKTFWFATVVTILVFYPGLYFINPNTYIFSGIDVPAHAVPIAERYWELAFLLPFLAITIKRLYDRNWSLWVIRSVIFFEGFILTLMHMGFFDRLVELFFLKSILLIFILAFYIWLIVENGFMKGTTGPNRYGSDPLQKYVIY